MGGFGYDIWSLLLGLGAGLACGFLNTAASSGSAVSLPILLMIGLDPVTANATNRVPVLIGALSATMSFHQRGALLWGLALNVSLPVAIGGLAGAGLTEILPGRELALIITAAVLVALVLLFTKLKQAIESAASETVRYGAREFFIFIGIGVWLGFIVLDGATYLLLVLILLFRFDLPHANALKVLLLVTTTLVPIVLFTQHGDIWWKEGLLLSAGSILGGYLGARVSAQERARSWVFRTLVAVILLELAQLGVHYFKPFV